MSKGAAQAAGQRVSAPLRMARAELLQNVKQFGVNFNECTAGNDVTAKAGLFSVRSWTCATGTHRPSRRTREKNSERNSHLQSFVLSFYFY